MGDMCMVVGIEMLLLLPMLYLFILPMLSFTDSFTLTPYSPLIYPFRYEVNVLLTNLYS